jgi:hypothetical protein
MGSSSQPSPAAPELDATYMAATRTLFAMLRTGSAVAGGGALVTKLLVTGWPSWLVTALSAAFVLLGYWIMWAALRRGRQLRKHLEITGREALFSHRQFALMTLALQALIAIVVVLFLLAQ